MSEDSRNTSIEDFRASNRSILLSSTLAGGVGLNLAVANKVLIADPWWNESIDYQAFMRAYRFGQQKDCELARMFTMSPGTKSIEGAMYCQQKAKQFSIDATM